MENAFYYFYSATPQVLGAILALFGVFIIFKIQNIKTQLIGIGKSLLTAFTTLYQKVGEIYPELGTSTSIIYIDRLKGAIDENNILELQKILDEIEHQMYAKFKNNFNELHKYLNKLIVRTILWSMFTIILILACLWIITYGPDLTRNVTNLYMLFSVILFLVLICFIGLLSILITALYEGVDTFSFWKLFKK